MWDLLGVISNQIVEHWPAILHRYLSSSWRKSRE